MKIKQWSDQSDDERKNRRRYLYDTQDGTMQIRISRCLAADFDAAVKKHNRWGTKSEIVKELMVQFIESS